MSGRKEVAKRRSKAESVSSTTKGKLYVNPMRIRPEDHSWLLEVNREQKYSDKGGLS